ncbi:small heat shock protein [Lactobacillus plantarum JDM1] [Lactiplantibacillus mudanjiangensis]|uniref:Hsp20/alpha crystallin family protein n=1 Tax=Lactiplantibacillus mudanjiangensis TaxID=1296538 RepID=UPI001014CD75|nr:Hsp20/alpha crystallin family protein [Lactiplantibacillus mudanjiangensis]VDG33003.1 small heat shock protein [Lactobacillus plantarum JDM1] [Lactiplantibacillus mudanjiangensis]
MRQQLLRHFEKLLPVKILRQVHHDVDTAVTSRLVMKTDVVEHDDDYTVTAALPGFDKNAINVQYADDWLTLTATHQPDEFDRDDDGRVLQRERQVATAKRRFYFKNVRAEAIQAHFEAGLLTVTLPKKVTATTSQIEIQ